METGGLSIGPSLGAVGFAGGAAATAGVAAPAAGTAPAAAQGPATIGADGRVSMSLDQLSELLEGFSTAEILLALMMMSGGRKRESGCSHSGGGDAGLALLAGMAIGGMLRGGGTQLQPGMQAVPPSEPAQSGGSLNVLA